MGSLCLCGGYSLHHHVGLNQGSVCHVPRGCVVWSRCGYTLHQSLSQSRIKRSCHSFLSLCGYMLSFTPVGCKSVGPVARSLSLGFCICSTIETKPPLNNSVLTTSLFYFFFLHHMCTLCFTLFSLTRPHSERVRNNEDEQMLVI